MCRAIHCGNVCCCCNVALWLRSVGRSLVDRWLEARPIPILAHLESAGDRRVVGSGHGRVLKGNAACTFASARTGDRDKLATVRVPIVPLAYGTTIRPSDCISENAPGPVGACVLRRDWGGLIGRWRAPPMVVRAPRAPLESRAPALLLRCEQRVASSAKAWRVR